MTMAQTSDQGAPRWPPTNPGAILSTASCSPLPEQPDDFRTTAGQDEARVLPKSKTSDSVEKNCEDKKTSGISNCLNRLLAVFHASGALSRMGASHPRAVSVTTFPGPSDR